jgi:hypothetical protein
MYIRGCFAEEVEEQSSLRFESLLLHFCWHGAAALVGLQFHVEFTSVGGLMSGNSSNQGCALTLRVGGAVWAVLAAVGVGLCASAALGAGVTQTVAVTGDAAPGTAAGVSFSFFSGPMLNDAGQVAFWSSLTGSVNNEGIWRGAPGSLSLVARKGSQAPGTALGVNYSSLFQPGAE